MICLKKKKKKYRGISFQKQQHVCKNFVCLLFDMLQNIYTGKMFKKIACEEKNRNSDCIFFFFFFFPSFQTIMLCLLHTYLYIIKLLCLWFIMRFRIQFSLFCKVEFIIYYYFPILLNQEFETIRADRS